MKARRRPWYLVLAQRRADPDYEIVIAGHALERMMARSIEDDEVEATVRRGSVAPELCERPDQLGFQRRRRTRDTLIVITRFRPTHIKVVTAYGKS